jgi:hypothetical protein
MLPHEVARIVAKQEEKSEKAPKLKISFHEGDKVKIKEGTFENFEGEVDSIDETNGRVTVMINIFGRSTPVTLEYWQMRPVRSWGLGIGIRKAACGFGELYQPLSTIHETWQKVGGEANFRFRAAGHAGPPVGMLLVRHQLKSVQQFNERTKEAGDADPAKVYNDRSLSLSRIRTPAPPC